jgi:hypothetical protein
MRDHDGPNAQDSALLEFHPFGMLIFEINIVADPDPSANSDTAQPVQEGPHGHGAGAMAREHVKNPVKDSARKTLFPYRVH